MAKPELPTVSWSSPDKGQHLLKHRLMKKTSAILKSLSDEKKGQITIGDVIAETGSRAHGFGLLLFALPEALPLPLPSLSTILAIPLILLSAHLIVFGEGPGIPERARRQTIRASVLRTVAKYATPAFERLERISHPRLEVPARQERFLAGACLLLSVILLLPIPLGNFLPALCLVAIAFGMLQRDGVIVGFGLVGLAAVLALIIFLTNFLWGA